MYHERAERIRDVLRYVRKFNSKTIVIHIDDSIIESPYFLSHISDISLIHEAGLHVVIVPGSRERINDILDKAHIEWKMHNGFRITNESAIPLIKMAAFDTSNKIMSSLAGEHKTALIGNWVKARGKGVIKGIDYGTCGEIANIETDGITKILESDSIPIFPCIGWSNTGKPYNISSVTLASEIAIALKAEKLFYLGNYSTIDTTKTFLLKDSDPIDENGKLSAMTIEQAKSFLKQNNTLLNATETTTEQATLKIIQVCAYSCEKDVTRTHVVDGSLDGALLTELFSDIGQGTMIYKNNYGGIRTMTTDDIPSVLSLMHPAIEKGILLARTEEALQNTFNDYIVYEMDGGIKACAALHLYNEKKEVQGEIAAVVVDENFSRKGIGPMLISYLIESAKKQGCKSVFILTTQTADWFESLGFKPDNIDTLPTERKTVWETKKMSKLFRLLF